MATKNKRSMKIAYYATTTPGVFVEAAVHYTKGMNYFNGESYTGYKVGFTPVTLKVERGFASTSFMMFSGLGFKVEAADRFNAKRLSYLAATVPALDSYAEVLAAVAAKEKLTLTGVKMTEAEAWASVAPEAAA